MTRRDQVELILLRYRDNYYRDTRGLSENGAINAIFELFEFQEVKTK